MKKLLIILFAFLLFPGFSLFAAPFDMILVGDPVLEDMRFLSLESGRAILSFTPPLAPAEVRQFLDSINDSDLSSPGREAYYRILKRLSPEAKLNLTSDNFAVFMNINSTFEARTRFNADIDWYPLYPEIAPVLAVPIRFFFFNTLQLYIEPSVHATPEHYDRKHFGLNVPYGQQYFDITQPLRAFIAAGGSWWNFQLGRDKIFFGTGNTGSLSIADNSAYYEYIRFSLFSRFFKYSLLVSQMPLRVTDNFYTGVLDPEDLVNTTQRNFYLHRLDFKFWNVLSIGVMEGLMVGNSPLEIRYLNPLMIFHSFYSSSDYEMGWGADPGNNNPMGHMNGSFFSVEINWHIIKSLSVYGQFVMNELALGSEKGDTAEPPNGVGFMAGINYSHSFDSWGARFFLEFIYTYPYLYLNSSPFASFIKMRRVETSKQKYLYYYMGYPRDTMALSLGTRFFRNDELNIGGRFSWICSGEHNRDGLVYDFEVSNKAFDKRTPSGTAEHKFIASVSARWKPLTYMSFNGSLTGIISHNNNHVSGSNAFGGQAEFSVSFFY